MSLSTTHLEVFYCDIDFIYQKLFMCTRLVYRIQDKGHLENYIAPKFGDALMVDDEDGITEVTEPFQMSMSWNFTWYIMKMESLSQLLIFAQQTLELYMVILWIA